LYETEEGFAPPDEVTLDNDDANIVPNGTGHNGHELQNQPL
jgi:hypothetical protein